MTPPRTPQEYFTAGKTFLQGQGLALGELFTMRNEKALKRRFSQKVGGERTANPWIISFTDAKSLILEASMPTDKVRLSTGCTPASTGCTVLPRISRFEYSLYLSIYLFKKKEERIRIGRGICKVLIHGFEQLLKKVATGYYPHPRLTRGYQWMHIRNIYNEISVYFGSSTHPRVALRGGTLESDLCSPK